MFVSFKIIHVGRGPSYPTAAEQAVGHWQWSEIDTIKGVWMGFIDYWLMALFFVDYWSGWGLLATDFPAVEIASFL